MAKVNLRDLYPFYKNDYFVDVPDHVLREIQDCKREEESYLRYLRFHKATVALDGTNADEIEHVVIDKPLMPQEVYDRKIMTSFLHRAIAQLPDKQAKRISAHFFLGMSFTEIAKSEGVYVSAVHASIDRGLRKLENILKSFSE